MSEASMAIGDARLLVPKAPLVSTWILDPPYNIGFNYGEGYKDNKKAGLYVSDIIDILVRCRENMPENGSIFLIHYPDIAGRLLPHIEAAGLSLHQWITWVYPSNIGHSKRRFTRAHRVILWLTKGEPKFKSMATYQAYRNPNDKRIRQRMAEGHLGVAHYDWWEINLCKNVSKDYRGYVNQIPYKLLERLILHTTDEGDWVGDCFAGSGSTIAAALENGRNGWGCDINPECAGYWGDIV